MTKCFGCTSCLCQFSCTVLNNGYNNHASSSMYKGSKFICDLFRTALGYVVHHCNEDLWILVSFVESSHFRMLESLLICITFCVCATRSSKCTRTDSIHNSFENALHEHVKTHSTLFAIYSNYTGIRSHSFSKEKKS